MIYDLQKKQALNAEGIAAEFRCAAELLEKKYSIFWPGTAYSSFDLLIRGQRKYSRLQIKSANTLLYQRSNGELSVTVPIGIRSNKKNRVYTKRETDFIIIYLSKYQLWYILPINKVRTQSVYLRPYNKKCKWARYLNAWSLLGAP